MLRAVVISLAAALLTSVGCGSHPYENAEWGFRVTFAEPPSENPRRDEYDLGPSISVSGGLPGGLFGGVDVHKHKPFRTQPEPGMRTAEQWFDDLLKAEGGYRLIRVADVERDGMEGFEAYLIKKEPPLYLPADSKPEDIIAHAATHDLHRQQCYVDRDKRIVYVVWIVGLDGKGAALASSAANNFFDSFHITGAR
jgi:hypothetical protein